MSDRGTHDDALSMKSNRVLYGGMRDAGIEQGCRGPGALENAENLVVPTVIIGRCGGKLANSAPHNTLGASCASKRASQPASLGLPETLTATGFLMDTDRQRPCFVAV